MLTTRFEEHALGRPYHAALVELHDAREPHEHIDFYEIMAVLDGSGSQDLGAGAVALGPGDLFLVRPGDHHALAGVDPGGVRFFNIAFPASQWRTFAALVDAPPVWDSQPPAPSGTASAETIEACRRVVERFHDAPTILDLVRFWSEVIPALKPVQAPVASSAPTWLGSACAAMRRAEHLRAGVPRLLSLASVSPAHLSRAMRRYYALTPTEFVAQLRLQRAATLLASTSMTIGEIGAECGYASASYFSRCFYAAHRMSPTEFRRMSRNAFVP